MSSFTPPGYCPNCGEFVEKGSSSCDSCGSCPETGWNEDSIYDGLDLSVEENERKQASHGSLVRMLGAIVLLLVVVYVFVFM